MWVLGAKRIKKQSYRRRNGENIHNACGVKCVVYVRTILLSKKRGGRTCEGASHGLSDFTGCYTLMRQHTQSCHPCHCVRTESFFITILHKHHMGILCNTDLKGSNI